MKKIRAAIVGYGNIGKYVLEALEAAPDFEVAGVVRRNPNDIPDELKGYTVTDTITKSLPDGIREATQSFVLCCRRSFRKELHIRISDRA